MKKWMSLTLCLAGFYNIIWGTWVVLFPNAVFALTGAKAPLYLEIWQCVGMIVAVYGLGYIIAAKSPFRHWPIILVGLMGKVFGPIGFAWSLYQGVFPLSFGWNIIFNDLIWWAPFTIILYQTFQQNNLSKNIVTVTEKAFKNFEDRKRAKFINSLSGVKSANLIGTKSPQGLTNLSIVSSVFHLGASPALVGFIIRPDTVRRDTLENIKATGFYTINHINHKIVENAHQTSARYPQDQSEFDQCNLTEQYLSDFEAPFVGESNIKIAVKFIREEKIPENGTILMIGQIQEVHLPENCIEEDGHINIVKAGTIGVSGLDNYLSHDSIGRLSYAKPKQTLEWLSKN